MDKNTYSESIVEWYDRIMEAGYYDHEHLAEALESILQGRRRILELGIGTGLLAEKMNKKGYEVSGVDFTHSMIAKARERLGRSVKLYEQNAISLRLPEKYEAIYSEGGVWFIACDESGNTFLESHIPDKKGNFTAMRKVIDTLENDGLLILGIQPIHKDIKSMKMADEAIYSQKVSYKLPFINKEYFVSMDGKTVAHQRCKFRRLTNEEKTKILQANGLSEIGMDKTGQFMIFQKAI